MKLSSLFAQYLYQKKKLNLPGIGSFEMDPSIQIPDSSEKATAELGQHIRFSNNSVSRPDEDFIDFIRIQTGKIRPLAESDLESYLADGKLMLSTGKPFFLEGIGTLYKVREGAYEFAAGAPILERLEGEKAGDKIAKRRPAFDSGYSQIEPEDNNNRKVLIGTVLALGLAAVIWGGYSLYNRNTEPIGPAVIEDQQTIAPVVVDTMASKPADTVSSPISTAPSQATPPGNTGTIRYLLETTSSKPRAIKRINQLALVSPKMQLEANADSSLFRVYVDLPGTNSDTTRIKDSLNAWYWGRKTMKVSVWQ